MKYKYSVRIHSVSTTEELETIMNEYGSKGIRVIKADLWIPL